MLDDHLARMAHHSEGAPEYREARESLKIRLLDSWNPKSCDERRYQSEERRLAILKAHGPGEPENWIYSSPPAPHPGTGHRNYRN